MKRPAATNKPYAQTTPFRRPAAKHIKIPLIWYFSWPCELLLPFLQNITLTFDLNYNKTHLT